MLDYSDPTLDLMKLIQEFSTLLKQVINCLRTPFAGKNAAISCKGPSFTISDTFPSMRVRERFLLTSMSLLLFLGIFDRQTVLLANSGFVLWSANLGSGLRSTSAMVSKVGDLYLPSIRMSQPLLFLYLKAGLKTVQE